ncbi:SAM-dependent MidA family methyltransferase [Neisseria sp. HSC-16F19]|nr:SAM-dependent methyltransferase [Neisseria sp. HSC-16F19]MCP2041504.1 SAM-dependent MidA family methyltransferase [Neisseria sp. HSC-16F19]
MSETLPTPDAAALAHSQRLCAHIRDHISAADGWIPFSAFMQQALYTPGLGYYSGGAPKFGAGGDFVTAPTLTPLFGQTLARQIRALLPQCGGRIYEFGAGNGALATTLLHALNTEGLQEYCIVEVSAELAERQRQYIAAHAPEAAAKLRHLHTLPDTLEGVVIGNEVLDAMPVEVIRYQGGAYQQMGVAVVKGVFQWQPRPLHDERLQALAAEYIPPVEGYGSEIHPQQQAFLRTLAHSLVRGAVIMVDYGFDAAQFYHPQRQQGTLIGHYRHHVVHDVFFHPGLTDITAHVNFTDLAATGAEGGLDLIGYTTQANFLLNLGITGLLAQCGDPADAAYIRQAAACQLLLSPQEMGELFKVMAWGRDVDVDWAGFAYGDMCHKL